MAGYAKPKDTFNEIRDEVAKSYKNKKIDLNEYKNDLRKLDIIEDTFNARQTIFGNVKDAIGDTFGVKEEN